MLAECPCCGEQCEVKEYRRLTQYCKERDADNYINCCKDCKIQDDAHWEEMWKEYYYSQGFGAY